MSISKAIDRLALAASKYAQSLGTAECERAFNGLKRAARDYANAIAENHKRSANG